MPERSKSFVRQSTYIIYDDNEKAKSETILEKSEKSAQRSARKKLVYAVHIKFCCPKKNRFFLYKYVRVIFPFR